MFNLIKTHFDSYLAHSLLATCKEFRESCSRGYRSTTSPPPPQKPTTISKWYATLLTWFSLDWNSLQLIILLNKQQQHVQFRSLLNGWWIFLFGATIFFFVFESLEYSIKNPFSNLCIKMYKLSINHVLQRKFSKHSCTPCVQVCWVTNKFIILQKVSLGGGNVGIVRKVMVRV